MIPLMLRREVLLTRMEQRHFFKGSHVLPVVRWV